jgi:hypothetical protein
MQVPNYNALVRMLANGTPTKPFSLRTMPPFKADMTRVDYLKSASAARYGRPREQIEAEISARYAKETLTIPALGGMM